MSFHRLALDVGKRRDWSSPDALFITWAFVVSFDVFGHSCISSVQLRSPASPGLLFGVPATGMGCLNVLGGLLGLDIVYMIFR